MTRNGEVVHRNKNRLLVTLKETNELKLQLNNKGLITSVKIKLTIYISKLS